MELPRYHLASYGAGAAGAVNPGGTKRRVPQGRHLAGQAESIDFLFSPERFMGKAKSSAPLCGTRISIY